MIQIRKPDFPLGQLVATPAAMEALSECGVDIIDLVQRHIGKDWGDLSDEDKRLNDDATTEQTPMTDQPIREPKQIRHDCSRKLRVVQVSDHFQAVLGVASEAEGCWFDSSRG